MYKLVLIRHGESAWNKENRFTGWTDVDLTEEGVREAVTAGRDLKKEGFTFDVGFSSSLTRANKTLNTVLDQLQLLWIPIQKSWRLNEKHYGDLQGLNKTETTEKFGEEQVKIWRRSYDIAPNPLPLTDPRHPANDPRYKDIPKGVLPGTESLKDTVERVLPYWFDEVAPKILQGKKVIIGAHGNSLRALIKYLDNMSESDILELNLPTAVPLVYELDKDLKPIKHYYVGDQAAIAAKIDAVKNQGKKK